MSLGIHGSDTVLVITTHIRSKREGTVFTGVCLLTFWGTPFGRLGGDNPISGPGGRYPI